jgi:hypothetical protein
MGSLQEYGVERRACHAKMVIWYGALGRSEISSELKGTIAEERSLYVKPYKGNRKIEKRKR